MSGVRFSTLLWSLFSVVIVVALAYRIFAPPSSQPMMNSSAEMPLSTRLQRLMNWGSLQSQDDRCLRVTIHLFEARSTGVLPLTLPPLEAAAVSRFGDRVFDIIRETAQYYDRLNALYPAAQFELLTAEEGFMVIQDAWFSAAKGSGPDGLVFKARDYTVRVNPASLDKSNWLTTQITVEQEGRFLLGNRVTSQPNGTPIVIGGPTGGHSEDGARKAVFVGVTTTFVSPTVMKKAEVRSRVFENHTFDRPPYLVELAEVRSPQRSTEEEPDGMSIFLTHIEANGQVAEIILVSPLHPDYDEAALDAIRRSRFAPASKLFQPVDAWMVIPVQFLSERRMPVVSTSKPGAE